jgi:hypothetical protein
VGREENVRSRRNEEGQGKGRKRYYYKRRRKKEVKRKLDKGREIRKRK